jgi:G:T-mismatch repair DNA endonuclease (very short patch repair protein)
MDRQRDLETRGYTVRVMWECELDRLLKSDKAMAAYFKNVLIHEPLDPRHAFFGGLSFKCLVLLLI